MLKEASAVLGGLMGNSFYLGGIMCTLPTDATKNCAWGVWEQRKWENHR